MIFFVRGRAFGRAWPCTRRGCTTTTLAGAIQERDQSTREPGRNVRCEMRVLVGVLRGRGLPPPPPRYRLLWLPRESADDADAELGREEAALPGRCRPMTLARRASILSKETERPGPGGGCLPGGADCGRPIPPIVPEFSRPRQIPQIWLQPYCSRPAAGREVQRGASSPAAAVAT